MPTLSIIQSGNKWAVTYMGEENEISKMLTRCAIRDELLAEAIIQSALQINRIRTDTDNKNNFSLQSEIPEQ